MRAIRSRHSLNACVTHPPTHPSPTHPSTHPQPTRPAHTNSPTQTHTPPVASFQIFSWGAMIFCLNFSMPLRLLKNWKKQHFICSNLTVIHSSLLSFFLFFYAFFLFFLFFFLFFFFLFPWGGGGATAPQPPQMTPLHPTPPPTIQLIRMNIEWSMICSIEPSSQPAF